MLYEVITRNPVISDKYRHEYQVFTRALTVGVEQDGEQAEFWLKQFSRAAPASLDKKLHVKAFFQQLVA